MRRIAVPVLVAALALPGVVRAANGQQLYGRYCLQCHGPLGVGQRPPSRTIGPSLRGVGALAADFYLSTGYMPLKRNGIQPRRIWSCERSSLLRRGWMPFRFNGM